MMSRLIAGLVVGMFLVGGMAYAQDQANGPSGQDYLDLPGSARITYVMGFAHGYQSAAVAASHFPDLLRQMQTCIQKTSTSVQAEAIVTQFVRATPGALNEPIAALATKALLQACVK